MADYLLAAHIQVTGGAEAASQFSQMAVQVNNFGQAASKANAGNLASGMKEASEQGGFLASTLDRVGAALTRMATYQGIFAVENALGTAKDAVINFDDAMTQSLAIQSNVTSQMRSGMEGLAESLAVKFGEAPEKVAKGFYFMASAGLDAQQQMATLPVVMDYARAGMMGLDKATEQLFDSLSAIGKRSKDPQELASNLTGLSNTLTEAAIKSQATIEQMGTALTHKAGAAIKGFNLDLNESVGVLEVFANQGIKGATAGERFSMLIRDMALKSQKFGDEWSKMGVQVFDSSGQFNSLTTIFGQLDAALLPLSGQDRIQALSKMGFTLRDISTVMSVLGSSGDIADFTFDLNHAGDVAQQVADKQMESLRAKMSQLSAAFKVGAIEGFDKLKEFGSWLESTFAPAIDAISPSLGALSSGIGNVFAGIGTAVGAVGAAGLEGIAKSIEVIGSAASSHQGAVTAFGVALGSLAAAKGFEGIAALAASLGGPLISAMSNVITYIRVIGLEMAAVRAEGGSLGSALSTGFAGVMEAINPVTIGLAAVAATAGVFYLSMKNNSDQAKQAVSGLATEIGNNLGISTDQAGAAMGKLGDEVGQGATHLSDFAQKAQDAITHQLAGKLASEGLGDAWHQLGVSGAEVSQALSTGTDIFGKWHSAADSAHGITNSMRDDLAGLPDAVRPLATELLNAASSGQITFSEFEKLTSVFDKTADATDQLRQNFKEFATDQLTGALFTGEIDSQFLKFFGIIDIGKASIQQLQDAMHGLENLRAPIDTKFWGEVDANMFSNYAGGIKDVGDKAADAEQQINDFKAALDALAGPANTMQALAQMNQGFNDLIGSTQAYIATHGSLDDAFSSTTEDANKLQEAYGSLAQKHIDFAKGLADQGKFDEAKAGLVSYRDAIVATLQSLNVSQPVIDDVINKLGLTDAAINGLNGKEAEVKVTDNGTAAATTQAVQQVPTGTQEVQFQASAVNVPPTQEELTGLQGPYPAPINATASPDAIAMAQGDLNMAAGPYTAPINAQANGVPEVTTEFDTAAADRTALATLNGEWAAAEIGFDTTVAPRTAPATMEGDTGAAQGAFDGAVQPRVAPATMAPDTGAAEAAFNAAVIARIAPATMDADWAAAEIGFDTTARFRTSPATQQAETGGAEGALNTTARGRSSPVTAVANTGGAEAALDALTANRTAHIDVSVAYTASAPPPGVLSTVGAAQGGIIHAYGYGGFEQHQAQIGMAGRSGVTRIWNEPETGGEAYIPLAKAKRDRSLAVWEQTGRMLGVGGSPSNISMNVPINVKIDGASDPNTTAQAVAGHVQRGIESAVQRMLIELRSV